MKRNLSINMEAIEIFEKIIRSYIFSYVFFWLIAIFTIIFKKDDVFYRAKNPGPYYLVGFMSLKDIDVIDNTRGY